MAAPVPHQVSAARSEGVRLGLALAGLLVLALSSWALAHVRLGWAETPVALGIAAIKASIVALVFMNLTRADRTARFVAVLVPFIVVLLVGLVCLDVGQR
jgi:cytochrome c oxidase subunit 4